MQRRDFLKTAGVAAAVTTTGVALGAPSTTAPTSPSGLDPATLMRVTDAGERKGDMLYRTLGRTGVKVSAIGLGGAHLSRKPLDEPGAVKLIHAAIDRGINFLDNCWDYGHGNSEKWMGTALAQGGYRKKAFLMTKLDGRTKESATSQLEESLKRLKTDHIDLVQFHEILRFDDPDRIFTEDGALEALVGREEGRQAAVHRLHRAQGSPRPPVHARGRREEGLPVRHRADAPERDGRALPQLLACGRPRGGSSRTSASSG